MTGNPKLGYDVGTVTSLALVGVAGPRAQTTSEMASVAMTALGGKECTASAVSCYIQ